MHSFPTSAPTITALRLSRNSSTLSIPSIAPKYPLVALRDLEKNAVSVPYVLPQPTDDTNWTLAFEKSADILLVGSWAPKTAVKANDGRRYGVDVAVTMPEVCCSLPRGLHSLTLCQTLFQEKDYLHSRFFHKRAYYIAVLVAAISTKKSGLDVDVLYESTNGDPRTTALILRSRQGACHQCGYST